jgi:hypothetical protein
MDRAVPPQLAEPAAETVRGLGGLDDPVAAAVGKGALDHL